MRRAGQGCLIVLACAVWLGGCSREKGSTAGAKKRGDLEPPASARAAVEHAPERPPPRVQVPPAQLTHPDAGASPVMIAPGQPLGSASSRAARTVELAHSGRVVLPSGAVATLGPMAPAEVLLVSGRARLLRPATGGAMPPLRVGTPAGVVVVPAEGEAWVAVLADGRTWVGVVSGEVTLETGDERPSGPRGRIPRKALVGGQEAFVGPAGAGAPRALKRGKMAPGAYVEQRGRAVLAASKPRAATATEAAFASIRSRLDGLLDAVSAEEARGRALAEAHRQAVTAHPDRARELRRQIVAHAVVLLQQHRRLLPLWERAASLSKAHEASDGAKDAWSLADQTARVHAALVPQP